MKSHYIIPIFVPFAGCPNKCVFCNQNKISGALTIPNEREVQKTIDGYLLTIPNSDNIIIEIAYYGGSFTGLPITLQRELLEPALNAKTKGLINYIRLSTRSDYINESVLKYLKEFQVDIIELGVQSLNNEVLRLTQRGHDANTVTFAISAVKNAGFKLGVQLMLGLPGDTEESFCQTVEGIIELKPDFIRLYPTLVIEGTDLARIYQQGLYQPLSLDEAIKLSKIALIKFSKNKIPVIRIGLQPTEEINNTKILAGPFHPAFRELVEADIMKDNVYNKIKLLLKEIKEKDKSEKKDEISLEININPRDHSIVRGQQNKNMLFLKREFPFISFSIKNNENLIRGQVEIRELF